MNIIYHFIGKLPEYTIDTIYQTRLFYNGPIYLITNDKESDIISKIIKYNVTIIEYKDVESPEFNEIYNKNKNKFMICDGLTGREKLFIYTFERYLLLFNLMTKNKLTNVLFMELDNLIYDDPNKWMEMFSRKEIAYMYDNEYRCGAGICYIKNNMNLLRLNMFLLKYIEDPNNQYVHEMKALHDFWNINKDKVQLLPTHWKHELVPYMFHDNYDKYNDTLFDVAGMGIYLGGLDPHHTNGEIKKGSRALWSYIDYTYYKYEWKRDEEGRNIPYIWNITENKWNKINNLHIHSKVLKDFLSK